jgi:tRNA dimethylallyltransferase
MIGLGALEECHEVLLSGLWDENHPSCKAIGAKELVGHIKQKNTLEIAINKSKIQTRQYAKRQRTWFRSKMLQWNSIEIDKI